jgi:hypothetical protein
MRHRSWASSSKICSRAVIDDRGAVKRWLKRRLSDRWWWRLRRLSRLRWITKYRILRRAGVSARRHLRYVLLDPELESYTYRVGNVDAMCAAVAEVTGIPVGRLTSFVAEAEADPELGERLARRVRWRLDVKRRPALGVRLGWYVLVRALRPSLVVETGIYNGLGSLALLRALERNRADGQPGELLSFDRSSEAGWMVDRSYEKVWRRALGSTQDTLEPAVAGRQVGALFQDTSHTEEQQRLEFGVALRCAAPELLLVDGSGGQSPTLARLSREHGGVYACVPLVAADHWYQRGALAFAVFRRDADG